MSRNVQCTYTGETRVFIHHLSVTKNRIFCFSFLVFFASTALHTEKNPFPTRTQFRCPPSWDRTQNYSYSVPWCLLTKVWTGEESCNSPAFTIINSICTVTVNPVLKGQSNQIVYLPFLRKSNPPGPRYTGLL